MFRATLFLSLVVASSSFATGCSTSPPPQATPNQKQAAAEFDLAKCETLEPSLYRCPGIDKPLCDPDFDRVSVQCVKITKTGVLLQAFPQE